MTVKFGTCRARHPFLKSCTTVDADEADEKLNCSCIAAFAILAYIYCLWYNEEFGYQKAKSRIHSSIQVGPIILSISAHSSLSSIS